MILIQILFFCFFSRCEEENAQDDDDFWDKLTDDDIVVEDNVKGNLYDKARFNLPIRRRMKLYPQVQKTIKYLHGRQNMEFIYESKIPTLIFLDSDDVAVEKIDISKMSKDDIISLLALRGFKDIEDQPMPKVEKSNQNEESSESKASDTNEASKSNEPLQIDEKASNNQTPNSNDL